MEFSEIEISDRDLINKYLNAYNPYVSEMSFTNLFMWRMYYGFRYIELDGLLCIISMPRKDDPYALMPIGNINEHNFAGAVNALKRYFNEINKPLKFSKVAEDELKYFRMIPGFEGEIVFDRDNSDYIYLAEDIINLKGKKFDSKRNHINRFKREYEYEYVELTSDLVDECVRIVDEWCAERDCNCGMGDYCERHANMEVLRNFQELGCKGALIKVDGRFEAFTVGERLNSNTAVIHIEKANSKIRGLYSIINQQFCEREWGHMKYINREQDLGVEGLRKAKLSYNPVSMINKYTIY